MAGPTTAQRGERTAPGSGPPRPPRQGRRIRVRLPYPRATALSLVLVLLLGAFLVWVLHGSSWLRVERVRVSGTDVLTPREVERAARVELGVPLASVDPGVIEERVRRSLPRAGKVTASRSWPHDLTLEVTERQPVLLIEKGGKFTEVDASGARFATVGRAPEGVPLLELRAGGSPSLRRFGTERLVREAVEVAGRIPGPVADRTRTIAVGSYDAITLKLKGGRTVDWGSAEQGEAKSQALTALMKATPRARHFDVSAPGSPASSAS